MATISFNVKPTPRQEVQIYTVLHHNGKKLYVYTGYNIPDNKAKAELKYWDKKKKRVRNYDDYERPGIQETINEKLSDWQNRFDNYKKKCKLAKVVPDIQLFKQSLLSEDEAEVAVPDNRLLYDVAKAFTASIKASHKDQTYRTYNVVVNQLAAYEKNHGKVYLSMVNEDFYSSFIAFLITEEKNTNNSIRRKLTRIVTFMNYAFKKGYIREQIYKIKPLLKGTPSKKVSILPDEMKKLEKVTLDNPMHQSVLDAFLLACYTGMRHSDVMLLQPVHVKAIKAQKTTVDIIDLTQFKGTKDNVIPLSKLAKNILEKYTPAKSQQPYFEHIHSQSASRILKDIFRDEKLLRECEVITAKNAVVTREIKPLCDIISFHFGRNTYITSLLALGMPLVYVKDNVGHADIRTTSSYSKQDDYARYIETLKLQNNGKK